MNNLYTLGYFRKRLLASGLTSQILIKNYDESDRRYWTISIGKVANIFCTCYKKDDVIEFEFWDGGKLIKNKHLITTQSMNVIVNFLLSLGPNI